METVSHYHIFGTIEMMRSYLVNMLRWILSRLDYADRACEIKKAMIRADIVLTGQDAGLLATNRRSGAVVEVSLSVLPWLRSLSTYHLVRMCDSCAQSNDNSMAVKHIERVTKKNDGIQRTRDDHGRGKDGTGTFDGRWANTDPLIIINSTSNPVD